MKLSKLIGKWIHDSKPLNEHFIVVIRGEEFGSVGKNDLTEGWITYTCANTSAFRQDTRVDRLIIIYETYIEDGSTKIEAADPHLFEKLERSLRRKHDRTGEYNMITFKDDCGVKLRDCGCVKAFCGC